jgi:hypothetical protein
MSLKKGEQKRIIHKYNYLHRTKKYKKQQHIFINKIKSGSLAEIGEYHKTHFSNLFYKKITLWNYDIDKYENNKFMDKLLLTACEYRSIIVIDFLKQLFDNDYFDYILYLCCTHNCAKSFKWLFNEILLYNKIPKRLINYYFSLNELFEMACDNGFIKIAEFIKSLFPSKYVIGPNNFDGSYDYQIRTKKEIHFQSKLFLLWLSSSVSPDNNNIFYKIPHDVSRYIIEVFV